jgi:hypothetical protein
MSSIRYLAFLFLFAVAATQAAEVAFPREHPRDLKAAQAQGLHRLTAEELKAFAPGTVEAMGARGNKPKLKIYKPDGAFEVQSFKTRTGTWRIDSGNNALCRTLYKEKKGGDFEQCYAAFRAPDGVHYFDYDIADSFYASTWRPKSK